jgi:hypothetical protein
LTGPGGGVTMDMPTSMVLTIHDETKGAAATTARLFTLPSTKLTARELIRERVIHEVRQHNDSPAEPFIGLIKLSDEELMLNGENRARRMLDPDRQVTTAFESFHRNSFTLLVDGTQVESLDQELALSADSQITFFRLYPLADD